MTCPNCQHVLPHNGRSEPAAFLRSEPFPNGTSAAASSATDLGLYNDILSEFVTDSPTPAGECAAEDAASASNHADLSSSLVSGEGSEVPYLDDSKPRADASVRLRVSDE